MSNPSVATRPSRARRLGAVGLATATAGLLTTVALPATASAAAQSCETRTNNTYAKLLQCIDAAGVLAHEQAFQAIAESNSDPYYPGTRAAGTAGYAGSVEYVQQTLEAAGWQVSLDPVDITFQFPVVLRQLTPVTETYESGAFTGSGFGTVEGNVVPVDLALADPASSTSGCEPADFAGLDFSGPNDIALVQRGTCFFSTKAVNAEAAGAEAVIIFNQGNSPERSGLIVGNAANLPDGSPSNISIPVVGASFAQGQALAQPGSTAFIEVLEPETRVDYNVLAELPGVNDDNVVMAGAHLDSVTEGPGINDNGSGSAALLELAESMQKVKPVNTVRLAWWAAEEQGLVGSRDYVAGLSEEELGRIAAYLNFDMIGSPNFIYGVYDADQSTFEAPVPVPDGSQALEDLFEAYYTWQGIPYEDSEFSGRSDYQAFINNGIPSSGLFTGAEVIKTPEQEAIWGGVAGDQYDPCYHLACDTIDNVSREAIGVNSDAVAFAILTLAYSTESVNGVPGKQVPGSPSMPIPTEFDGPQGTFGSDGGDAHEHGELD